MSRNRLNPLDAAWLMTETRATPNHVGNAYYDTGGAGIGSAFVAFYTCSGSETTIRWYVITTSAVASGPGARAGLAANVRRCFPIKNYEGTYTTCPVLVDSDDGSGSAAGTDVSLLSYDATTAPPGSLSSGTFVTSIIAEHMVQSQPVNVRGSNIDGTELSGVLLGVGYYSTKQFVYQVIGIVMGSILCVGFAHIFMTAFPVLKVNSFDHPEAKVAQWQSASSPPSEMPPSQICRQPAARAGSPESDREVAMGGKVPQVCPTAP